MTASENIEYLNSFTKLENNFPLNPLESITFEEDGELISLKLSSKPIPDHQREIVMPIASFSLIQCLRYFFPKARIERITFDFQETDATIWLKNVFGCEVLHNYEACRILISKKYLQTHIVSLMYKESGNVRKVTTNKIRISNQSKIQEDVIRLLEKDLGQFRHAYLVAKELSMSSRTLRRKLRIANTNHRELLKEVRMTRAMDLLRLQKISLTDIALKLHFSDSSAFASAFRDWAGMSPSEYRCLSRES